MQTLSNNPCKVMIVDDSSTIRSFLSGLLKSSQDISLVGTAENGQVALDKVPTLKPDILLMDVEMPVMDGITALPKILSIDPNIKIIMVSTLTGKNAATSIKALSCGASDYLEKPSANTDKESFSKELIDKILALSKKSYTTQTTNPSTLNTVITPKRPEPKPVLRSGIYKKPEALAIGSSTGGPQALMTLLEGIGNKLSHIPIFITQHMPPQFTTFLAERINNINGIKCVEAKDNMTVEAGTVYIAQGGYHMIIQKTASGLMIKLDNGEMENFCRPAVDPMLRSLIAIYGSSLLTVILTGMGQDGLLGCKKSVDAGGQVVAQDEKSSVVWGMPGAVANAGLCSKIVPITEMAGTVLSICNGI